MNFCCNTFTLKSQDNTLIDTCLALLKRSLPRVIPFQGTIRDDDNRDALSGDLPVSSSPFGAS